MIFYIWNHTHSEQFKEFKEYEQKKKTSLKQKQYEAGKYSVVSLCITWIKSRRLTSCLLLTENWKWNDENTVENWIEMIKEKLHTNWNWKDYEY